MTTSKLLTISVGAFILFLGALIPTLSHGFIALAACLEDGNYLYRPEAISKMVWQVPIYVWIYSALMTLIGLKTVWTAFQPSFEMDRARHFENSAMGAHPQTTI